MAEIKRFEDIEGWKKARELVSAIYAVSSQGSFAKDSELKDQIRRAAVSVMSSIAEGFERGGDKEFSQFLSLAKASCGEVRSQLYVALDQKYLSEEQFQSISEQTTHVSQLIAGFMRYLRQSNLRGSKYLDIGV
jgi:four helix bundle protein